MINKNELRTDNYILHKNKNGEFILQVYEIKDIGVTTFFNDGGWLILYEEIEGIPLTPEILEKCGFEIKEMMFENVHMKYWRNKFFIWHPDVNQVYLYNEKDTLQTVSIQYLHQLQNLYFALTNEALQINFEKEKV